MRFRPSPSPGRPHGIAFVVPRWRPDAPAFVLLRADASAIIAIAAAKGARPEWGATIAIIAVLLLHLPADWITGQKVLWPGGPATSFILYDRPLLDLALELPILLAGWWLIRRDNGVPRAVRSGFALAALIAAQMAFDGLKFGEPPARPGACALPRAERVRPMTGPDHLDAGTEAESRVLAVRAHGH